MRTERHKLLVKIRAWIIFFMVSLALSGITAFPVETELNWLLQFKTSMPAPLASFITTVYEGLKATNTSYPFLAYGYDWLAYAHIVFALMFIGPLKDPVKNVWVIEWAMIACVGIIPLAFIAGPVRSIPLYWTFIDCSFGVIGIIPLIIVHRMIGRLKRIR